MLDFHELNVNAYTVNTDICAHELRKWQKKGCNVLVLDFWKTYLQVHVHQSLLLYQTVIFERKRYYLIYIGFGLDVVPSISGSILWMLHCRKMMPSSWHHQHT